jgi:hypothetical protein
MRRIPSFPARRLALLLPLFLWVAPLRAQEGDATEGAPFLLLPVGARAVAMGRAVTALAGPESVFWNPAGLAELTDSRLTLFRDETVAGETTAASGLFSRAGVGTIGLTYDLFDVGEQDVTDEQNNVLGTISTRNHLGIVSVATQFAHSLNVGFNFKVLQFRQACRGQCLDPGVTATTYAIDAGVQMTHVVGLPLRLGAMVAHAGPKFQIKNEEQADPIPTRLRASAAYEVLGRQLPAADIHLSLAGEVEERWRDPGSPAVYLGSEFSGTVEDAVLLLRAGYVISNGEQVDGAAVGVGIRYSRFDLGLAKSLSSNISDDTEPVHVTFGLAL